MPIISDVNSIRRDGIVIDRNTGATKDSAKFDYDVIPIGSKFKFFIELENIEGYQLDLIALALKDMYDEGDLFGGKLSRGIGKCKIENLKIQYVNESNLKNYILKKKKMDMDENTFFKFNNLSLVD